MKLTFFEFVFVLFILVYLVCCFYLGLEPNAFDDNINNIVMSLKTMI